MPLKQTAKETKLAFQGERMHYLDRILAASSRIKGKVGIFTRCGSMVCGESFIVEA